MMWEAFYNAVLLVTGFGIGVVWATSAMAQDQERRWQQRRREFDGG